jgi:DNA (cytosine-5)-methyltransferase 1
VIQLYPGEIIIDSFAGGGGASTGIELALGRSPEVAINHDEEAIAMHAVNHPSTRHYVSDVWEVDPVEACGGRKVGLAWFSPDCKHFSKAKGGKPVDKNVRGLAWMVVRWAKTVKPRIIVLENVEEFQTWGPLVPDGKGGSMPCPARRGLTFRRWVAQLRSAGYQVDWKELRACDFGAPTTRKRLFVIARCDGEPIVWPEPTHGPGGEFPYRTAAECIDFSIACPSIFLTKKQAKKLGYDCRRPLAENTLRRIARGVQRYIIDAKKPFIVPSSTAPLLIQTGYGERKGQDPRCLNIQEPLGTVVACGIKHAVAQVQLERVAAFIAKHNGGNEATGQELDAALDTVTCRDSKSLVTSTLVKLRGTSTAADVKAPAPTITAGGNHIAEVRAFLVKYFGTDQDPRLEEPLHTITTKPRFALVTVHGEQYAIVDIGMRMLAPRELYRAQGFPDSYVIDFTYHGEPLSKEAQVRMVGNSVSPPLAAALVRANVGAVERLAEVA